MKMSLANLMGFKKDEVPKGAFVLVKEKLHLFGTTNVYILVYVKI